MRTSGHNVLWSLHTFYFLFIVKLYGKLREFGAHKATSRRSTPTCGNIMKIIVHQLAIGSVTIVLHHSAIDGDLRDTYLKENLRDYNFKQQVHF